VWAQGSDTTFANWNTHSHLTIPSSILPTSTSLLHHLSVYHAQQYGPLPLQYHEQAPFSIWLTHHAEPWQQHLLSHHRQTHINDDNLRLRIITNTPISIYFQTTFNRPHTHYGWLIGDPPHHFWQGSGNVSNAIPTGPSRTRLHGLLAALELIGLYRQHHLPLHTDPILVNLSTLEPNTFALITQCQSTAGPLRYNIVNHDIIAQLRDTLSKHQIQIQYPQNLNAHQAPPPHHIEPNNLARDLAATRAQQHHPLSTYHFPAGGASLLSDTNLITGSLSYSIRMIKNTKALRQHTEQRNHWPPQIWDTIDWDAHHSSLQRLPKTKKPNGQKVYPRMAPDASQTSPLQPTSSLNMPTLQQPTRNEQPHDTVPLALRPTFSDHTNHTSHQYSQPDFESRHNITRHRPSKYPPLDACPPTTSLRPSTIKRLPPIHSRNDRYTTQHRLGQFLPRPPHRYMAYVPTHTITNFLRHMDKTNYNMDMEPIL